MGDGDGGGAREIDNGGSRWPGPSQPILPKYVDTHPIPLSPLKISAAAPATLSHLDMREIGQRADGGRRATASVISSVVASVESIDARSPRPAPTGKYGDPTK